ncbi:unnamed protein product, partial [marine sediment metagenome]
KTCCKCKRELPVAEFYKHRKYDDGLQVYCKKCNNEVNRKSYRKHCTAYRATRRAYCASLRRDALQAYGNKCACCGEEQELFLSIDHIDGGGTQHRKEISGGKGGHHFYLWLKEEEYPPGFQTLCCNCNWGKYRNNNTCPHQEKR